MGVCSVWLALKVHSSGRSVQQEQGSEERAGNGADSGLCEVDSFGSATRSGLRQKDFL